MRNCHAEHIRMLAEDLRAAGDVPLVHMTEDGVSQCAVTLADELWLIAFQMDGYYYSERSARG